LPATSGSGFKTTFLDEVQTVNRALMLIAKSQKQDVPNVSHDTSTAGRSLWTLDNDVAEWLMEKNGRIVPTGKPEHAPRQSCPWIRPQHHAFPVEPPTFPPTWDFLVRL
jgi:hypothetical protein